MKKTLKIAFTIVGSVIGAGFISGKELVRFLGDSACIPVFIILFFLFFGYTCALLSVGKRYGGFEKFSGVAFGRFKSLSEGIFLACSFVVTVAMLAGIDALERRFAPYISLLTAAGCFFVLQKGIEGLSVFNSVLVPFIVVYLFAMLFLKGEFLFSFIPSNPGMDIFFCWLYVTMNLFLSAPVVVDCGNGLKSGKQVLSGGILSAAVVTACVVLVQAAIAAHAGAARETMPLLEVLGGNKFFTAISFLGIVTTLISSYYPLHALTERFGLWRKNAARIVILAAAALCARLGLDDIVEHIYPLLGALGAIFLSVVIFHCDFFQKRYQKIHAARQKAKNGRGGHDEI